MPDTGIKPCPFCGGIAEMCTYGDDEWLIYCKGCNAMVEIWFKTEAEAIEAWNRRVQ